MTIIEFFDKNAIENIIGAMLCNPERVVVVGDNGRKMAKSCDIYRNILRKNGINTEMVYSVIDKTDLSNVVECLDRIVAQIEDVIFDLTGGDELYLVAVGIIIERYGDRIKSRQFNFDNDTVNDYRADVKEVSVKNLDISFEDNIAMYGGDLVTATEAEIHTCDWQHDDEFADDLENMWSICKKSPRIWNAQIGVINKICDEVCGDGSLTVSYDPKYINRVFGNGKKWYGVSDGFLMDLQSYGLIHSLRINQRISFEFKNEKVKCCLTIAGKVLEFFVASRLRCVLNEDGMPMYNDVHVGAVLGWNADEDETISNVINEIDVVAMKGAVPVFISCKNGFVEANEIYKLNTVAERFGGKYAKRVLVTSNLVGSNFIVTHLKERMEDMEIVHIDNVYRMSDYDFKKILVSL